MQEFKERIPLIIVCLLFIGVCVLGYYLVAVHTEDYFTQIDNTNIQQLTNMEYEYNLRAYNEHGRMSDVTFKSNRELREDAFLKLKIMMFRGVVNWEEVQYDELPQDVQVHYERP